MEIALIIIKTIILALGFGMFAFNALLVGISFSYPYIAIPLFILLFYLAYKHLNREAFKYAIYTVLLGIISVMIISIKATDNISQGDPEGLYLIGYAIDKMVWGSLFSIIDFITFVLMLIKAIGKKKNEDDTSPIVSETKESNLQCPYCKTWVKNTDDLCKNCGNKLH